MKKLFSILFLTTALLCAASAQSYTVYTIVGTPSRVTKQGKKPLRLRDELTLNTVINMPADAEIELLDIKNKQQLIIKTAGSASIANFLQNKKNKSYKLTENYFRYILNRVKGNEETVVRTCVEPGIVTRKQRTDSTACK